MHILITGGAGFIGSQLTDFFLKKNYHVTVFDNLSWGKKEFLTHNFNNPKFRLVVADLLDEKKIIKNLSSKIDTIFHLAANSDIMRGAFDAEIDFKNTVIATFNLLQAMRKKNISKIFFISGSGIYGDVKNQSVKENYGPLFPISMYGATKLSAEAIISSFVNLYNIKAWILRPANIVGPRATHGVIFDFINQLKQHPKHLKILGDGNQKKSYLYVDDVLEGIDLIWKKANNSINVFNISSNTFITVNQIAKNIIKIMGLKNTTTISYTGGKRGWKGDVPIIRLNNQTLTRLGWKNSHTSTKAVLKTIKTLLKT